MIIDTLYAPTFPISLLSIGHLYCLGYCSTFLDSTCTLQKGSKAYITGHISENNLYTIIPECNMDALILILNSILTLVLALIPTITSP
jgi:hypothetical protein